MVAGKLRVKRQLSRLDKILKLPRTLREEVGRKNFKAAARKHVGSKPLLREHGKTFSSLAKIQVRTERGAEGRMESKSGDRITAVAQY